MRSSEYGRQLTKALYSLISSGATAVAEDHGETAPQDGEVVSHVKRY
jgi:hypothetical protein